MRDRQGLRTVVALLLLAGLAISCTTQQTGEPILSAEEPVPIIWDDDGSIDGVTALLYFLQHPSFEVIGATISPGIAHPRVFASKLRGLLTQLQAEGIPVAAGRDQPLSGDNAFPDDWRLASDDFWNLSLPESSEPADQRTASELIVSLVKGSDQPVTVFVSGPLTNLAEAFRMDPSIKEHIRTVEIMGGALEVRGNVSLSDTGTLPAEWNIYIDPQAAAEVFASGVDIRLTPLDSADRVRWGESDAMAWEASDPSAGSIAAQLLRQTMRDWSSASVMIWDLVSAVNASDRGLCEWHDLHIDVAVDGGMGEGQTLVVAGEAVNATACLDPDRAAYKDLAKAVFGRSE